MTSRLSAHLQSLVQSLELQSSMTDAPAEIQATESYVNNAKMVLGEYDEKLNELVRLARKWEAEIEFWENLLGRGGLGVSSYFAMTLPQRLYSTSKQLLNEPRTLSSLFPTLPNISRLQHLNKSSLTPSFLHYTRLEISSRIKTLRKKHEEIVESIGALVVQPPNWDSTALTAGIISEVQRSKQVLKSLKSPPELEVSLKRPNRLTRYWIPLILLPIIVPPLLAYIPMGKQAFDDAKETFKGFLVNWVVEPVKGIIDTVRFGSGEGGRVVSEEGAKSDLESLQRMVLSFAGPISAQQAKEISESVTKGDLSLVMRAYEKEIESPISSVIRGKLVRGLLIQVQKTKCDLDLALEGIDKLLRSQELTFAFIGVAPSLLILYLFGGWLKTVLAIGTPRGQKVLRRRGREAIRAIELHLLLLPSSTSSPSAQSGGTVNSLLAEGQLHLALINLRSSFPLKKSFLSNQSKFKATKSQWESDMNLIEDVSYGRDVRLKAVNRAWRSWSKIAGWEKI